MLCSEVVFGDQQDSVTHSKLPAKPYSEQKATVCSCGAAAGCSIIGGFLCLKLDLLLEQGSQGHKW